MTFIEMSIAPIRLRVRLDRRAVERVDDRRAGGADLPGDRVELRLGPSGEVDLRALTRERARHRAPDAPRAAVDDRRLAVEQHASAFRSSMPP